MALTSDDPEAIARQIDDQIVNNYVLSDSNHLALERLRQDGMVPLHKLRDIPEPDEIDRGARKRFEKRLNAVDPKLHRHFLYSYANPVLNKLGIAE
jgi:hypothetical protein